MLLTLNIHYITYFKLYNSLQTALTIAKVIMSLTVFLVSICQDIVKVYLFLRFSENFVVEIHKT